MERGGRRPCQTKAGAARHLLQGRAAGPGIRSAGQARPGLGPGLDDRLLRLAARAARHLRRSPGQRLDRQLQPPSRDEVHAHTASCCCTLGQYEKTNGSADTTLLGGPSGIWVDPKTNEAFISDGYRNRRIIVFDGATGKYLRHWGAYGNVPDDTEKFDPKTMMSGALPKQFSTPHGITGSNDGKIYVADRRGNRVQVFDQQGKFLAEKVIAPATLSSGSAFVPVLSPDAQQSGSTWPTAPTTRCGSCADRISRSSASSAAAAASARPVPAPARHERRFAGQPLRRRSVDRPASPAIPAAEALSHRIRRSTD